VALNPRTRARLLWLALGLLGLVAVVVWLTACSAPGGGGGALGWLLGPSVDPGPAGGGAGDGVPGVWGGLGDSISSTAGQIRWWFALGGLACFGLGVYRAIRADLFGAAKCLAAAIGLGIVGSIVGALFEGLAWLAVIVCGIFGVVLAVQWGRGRSVFGHSLGCVLGLLTGGRLGHVRKHESVSEVTP